MSFHPAVPRALRRPPLIAVAVLALALALALAPPARAAEPPLSLAEVVRVAVAQSSQLASQQAMIKAAREMTIPAGELPDPKLIAGFDNVPTEGADRWSLTRDFMTMTRIGVMQDFPRAEKRELRVRRAEREAAKGEAQLAASAASIRREAASAWLARYFAEATDRAIVEQLAEVDLAIETANAAYRAGRGMQSEILAMHAMAIELKNRRIETAMLRDRARAALARYVGVLADRPLGDAPDLTRVPLDDATLADVDRQPELRLAQAQEDVAAAESAIARAAKLPDWSAEVSYGIRGSGFANMVSVMVRVDLPWSASTRQDREYAAKLAEQDAARAMREDTRRMRDAEVKQMQVEWRAARAQAARMRDELLPLVQQRIDAALCSMRASRSSTWSLPPRKRGRGSRTSLFRKGNHEHDLSPARREAAFRHRHARRCGGRRGDRILDGPLASGRCDGARCGSADHRQ
jgi:outer membrane protein TolC